jgi:hypothetical protein
MKPTLTTPEKPVHKPSCAYLCSGDEAPYAECDCGAIPRRSLVLSMGVRSCQLLVKAIGRLDSDEVKEAERLGLTPALSDFLRTTKPEDKALDEEARKFGEAVEELWQKTNMRWSHPLDLKNVWKSLRRSLEAYKDRTPEENAEAFADPREKPYGVGNHGQYDEPTLVHVFVNVVTLGFEPEATVAVGIRRGHGRFGEACVFWPELTQTGPLWRDLCPKLKKWAEADMSDRVKTTRRVAERLLELLSDQAFKVEARTRE